MFIYNNLKFSFIFLKRKLLRKKNTESEFQLTENHFTGSKHFLGEMYNGSKYSNGSFNVIRKTNGVTNGDHIGKTNGETLVDGRTKGEIE